ncbi:hypothetical protein [Sedimenticola hydrogenitrophicus]|uniref:hypothetical protein n=1 Tax=Sedimenticola hydrogenitrophicus TaxID=2967975 RepID=UPI0021A43A31|nr:hypothetical protein [Sedimenticola hydrogenitrophicus]
MDLEVRWSPEATEDLEAIAEYKTNRVCPFLIMVPMHPVVRITSDNTASVFNYTDQITSAITSFNCAHFFLNHLDSTQSDQRVVVTAFQDSLCKRLSQSVPSFEWNTEYKFRHNQRDSIDIFGANPEFVVIIELDKHRADQVTKKFVSRISEDFGKSVLYISLCYPGTKSMNLSECIKYLGYLGSLSERIGTSYIGMVIEQERQGEKNAS